MNATMKTAVKMMGLAIVAMIVASQGAHAQDGRQVATRTASVHCGLQQNNDPYLDEPHSVQPYGIQKSCVSEMPPNPHRVQTPQAPQAPHAPRPDQVASVGCQAQSSGDNPQEAKAHVQVPCGIYMRGIR
ncbi:MAG: hypothetical protein ACYDCC_11530 [Actinomycetota bacterium]